MFLYKTEAQRSRQPMPVKTAGIRPFKIAATLKKIKRPPLPPTIRGEFLQQHRLCPVRPWVDSAPALHHNRRKCLKLPA
jgi:hypothetical protein